MLKKKTSQTILGAKSVAVENIYANSRSPCQPAGRQANHWGGFVGVISMH